VIFVVWVLEAHALPDHRVRLRFSDGSAGAVDLQGFVFADARRLSSRFAIRRRLLRYA
jgi:hypothetical protein